MLSLQDSMREHRNEVDGHFATAPFKKLLICVLIVSFLEIPFKLARAEENASTAVQKKSVFVATVLGILPVPGLSLYYAGKPKQALGNVLLTVVGAGMVFSGAYLISNDASDACVSCDDAFSLIFPGFGVWAVAMVWDTAGGISGVRKYNREAAQTSSSPTTFQPTIAFSSRNIFGGFNTHF